MKFYQLTKENMQLKEMLEKEEITELDYQENKEMLMELIKDKAIDLVLVNKTFENDIEGIDNFIKVLQDKKKALITKQENFNKYIQFNMEEMKLDKIDTPLGKISIKEYKKTTVNEELLGNDAYDYVRKMKTQKELKELGYEKALETEVTKKLYIK